VVDQPSRVAIFAALRAEGLEPDADLAAVAAAAGRLGFGLELAAFAGRDQRGRPLVQHRATVSRAGVAVAVVYLSESAQAAAFEALGRAILVERAKAGRADGGPAAGDDREEAVP